MVRFPQNFPNYPKIMQAFQKEKEKTTKNCFDQCLLNLFWFWCIVERFPTSCSLMDSKSMLIFQLKFHMLLLKIWVLFPFHCMTDRLSSASFGEVK